MTSPSAMHENGLKKDKGQLRVYQKMFFNETEDEYEESKMVEQRASLNADVLMRQRQMMSLSLGQAYSQGSSVGQQQIELCSESGSEQFSYSEEQSSEQVDTLSVDYQLIRLQTLLENCYEEFVTKECILQPNILEDIGRQRFILIYYAQKTMQKSLDDDDQFDGGIYCRLMEDFQSLQHFIYIEYPYLGVEIDQEEQVAKYELMTDEEFEEEFQLMHEPESIDKIVEFAKLESLLDEPYYEIEGFSRKHFMRENREREKGPLDDVLMSDKLFEHIGKFANQTAKSQDNFKVSIRKEPNAEGRNKPAQQTQPKSQLQLFSLQPIGSNDVKSQPINQPNTKNLTYQQFVSILDQQKKEQEQKKQQLVEQKKVAQPKKSQFDQILGRRNDQTSQNFLKPFIGEFAKKESDAEFKEVLGLNQKQVDSPQKVEKQNSSMGTPNFKPIGQPPEKNPSQQPLLNSSNTQQANPINLQQNQSNITPNPFQGPSQVQGNRPSLAISNSLSNKSTLPNVQSVNPFMSSQQGQRQNQSQLASKSPPSIINTRSQLVNNVNMPPHDKKPQLNLLSSTTPMMNPHLNANTNPATQQNNMPITQVSPHQNNIFQNFGANRLQGLNNNNVSPVQNLGPQRSVSPPVLSNSQQTINRSVPFGQGRSMNFQNISQAMGNVQPQQGNNMQNSNQFQNRGPILSNVNQMQNGPVNRVQNSFNQPSKPFVNSMQSLPTQPHNCFIGQQQFSTPTLPNMLPQVSNSQMNQIPTNKVQTMTAQNIPQAQNNRPVLNKNGHPLLQQPKYSKLEIEKNLYDQVVLQNMSLKQFIDIFCSQQLRDCYSDLFAQLLLMKKWKIVDFRIDCQLNQKFRYLSELRNKNASFNDKEKSFLFQNTSRAGDSFYIPSHLLRADRDLPSDPYPLMTIITQKMKQLEIMNHQLSNQRDCQLIGCKQSKLKDHIGGVRREFTKIEQAQLFLEKKISLFEKKLDLPLDIVTESEGQRIFSSMDEQLSVIGQTLVGFEKWIMSNEFCTDPYKSQQEKSDENFGSSSGQGGHFELLAQLYTNLSHVDTEIDFMDQQISKFKR